MIIHQHHKKIEKRKQLILIENTETTGTKNFRITLSMKFEPESLLYVLIYYLQERKYTVQGNFSLLKNIKIYAEFKYVYVISCGKHIETY